MFSQNARKFVATTLAFILLGTTWAAAAPQQTQTPTATTPTQDAKDKKAKKDQKKDDQATTDADAAATANDNDPKRPLSVNEDPRMIGKRNINTGIWAKMSGSLEKEVALGQQLAAEIDRATALLQGGR